jgi:hypothetical protein
MLGRQVSYTGSQVMGPSDIFIIENNDVSVQREKKEVSRR